MGERRLLQEVGQSHAYVRMHADRLAASIPRRVRVKHDARYGMVVCGVVNLASACMPVEEGHK